MFKNLFSRILNIIIFTDLVGQTNDYSYGKTFNF